MQRSMFSANLCKLKLGMVAIAIWQREIPAFVAFTCGSIVGDGNASGDIDNPKGLTI